MLITSTGKLKVNIYFYNEGWGVTQGYPLSMVLYGIALSPLEEKLCMANLALLMPFYVENTVFDW